MPHIVELAINRNGQFAGWQEFGPFPTKRDAWNFIQSKGYTAADKNDAWMAYPAQSSKTLAA